MTAPEPHAPLPSRRAARLLRERDAERASEDQTEPVPVDRGAESAAPHLRRDRITRALPPTQPLPVIETALPPLEPISASADPLPPAAAAPVGPPPSETRRSRAQLAAPTPTPPPGTRRSRAQRAASERVATPTPTRVGASRPTAQPSRSAARTAELLNPSTRPARHARTPRRPIRVGVVAGLAVVASLVLGSTATMTAAVTGQSLFVTAAPQAVESEKTTERTVTPTPPAPAPLPAPAESIPAPTVAAAPAVVELCTLPDVVAALAVGDDARAIAAAGGAEAFRSAVAAAMAPCVNLGDPGRIWTVINKTRPLTPVDYRPDSLAMPDGVRSTGGGSLRSDAAAALSALAGAAYAAGVGEIALESGFRSLTTQESTYGSQASAQGAEEADRTSARPGFSEHQSGLAADVVPCGDGCGTLDDLGTTAQGQWIVEHAWEFGWITRYEDGFTPVTGYSPEPWHLRYIGPELARAYHDGGWHTLEEFFGLGAAPGYLG